MKYTNRIILPRKLYDDLRNNLFENLKEEAAAFILAGVRYSPSGITLLGRRLVKIPNELYNQKNDYHLDVSPQVINGLAALCESNGMTAILCHSHVGAKQHLKYSASDDFGEKRLCEFLGEVTNNLPVGSIVVNPATISARLWIPGQKDPHSIDTIRLVGDYIEDLKLIAHNLCDKLNDDTNDRQIKLIGRKGQTKINNSCVAIVGLGATGSCVAEQLTRMSIGKLILIDDDKLEESNITRVYGSFRDTRLSRLLRFFCRGNNCKVDILKRHLKRINPDVEIDTIRGNIVASNVAQQVLDCDVIALCTDDHWGRSIVNEISYQYLIPAVNMGVRVDTSKDTIAAASADIHVLSLNKPCLWCYQYLSSDAIRAESMLPEQREELQREGYVQGQGKAPMVVSLTTTIAGFAATEILHILTGFRSERTLNRLKWDILDYNFTKGPVQQTDKCICKKIMGFGDLKPLSTVDDNDFVRRCRV